MKFGFRFSGMGTNWEEIIQVLQWSGKFKETFGPSPIPNLIIPSNVGEISQEEHDNYDVLCGECWDDQLTEESDTMFGDLI